MLVYHYNCRMVQIGVFTSVLLSLVAAYFAKCIVAHVMKPIPACKNIHNGSKPHLSDFYEVSLQSRGGYCEVHPCKKIPKGQNRYPPLTIRNLVPVAKDGDYPSQIYLHYGEIYIYIKLRFEVLNSNQEYN